MHDPYYTFQQAVLAYYRAHGRHDLPWRRPEPDGSFDPYKILVSEIMLQQTQVPRVIPKYRAFLGTFPAVSVLAAAPLGDILIAWQGLGYNRRAKFLWQAARTVVHDLGGTLPRERAGLERLPGVGANTAGAVLAYAYNEPAVFVETNIRTVFIHHFFPGQAGVPDKAVIALVGKTLPASGKGESAYREWYWALMDYGAYLKQTVGNLSRAGKAYARQSKFAGSSRQLRGNVLRLLAAGPMPEDRLLAALADPRAGTILQSLEAEGIVCRRDGAYVLP